MGREDAGEGALAEVVLHGVPVAGEVRVVRGSVGRPDLAHRRTHGACDTRSQSVGADHHPRVDRDGTAVTRSSVHARHPAVVAALDAVDRDPGADRCAGPSGGILEDRVEHVAARRHEVIDAVTVLDGPRHRDARNVERHVADLGCTALDNVVEQTPTMELDHAGTGDGMGGERVAGELGTVDHQHVVAGGSQEHRRRCAGTSCADYDDVGGQRVGVVTDRWDECLVRHVASVTSRPRGSLENSWTACGHRLNLDARPAWHHLVAMRYVFEDCELDTEAYELRRAGEPVQLQPQVFEVLAHLVRHAGRLVTKEELLDGIWGDRFVSESALTSRLKAARRAIGDDGQTQRCIRTVHGRGYRFVASVVEIDGPTSTDDDGAVRPRRTPTSRRPSPVTPRHRSGTPSATV